MRSEFPPQPDPDPAVLARAQARLLAGLSQIGDEQTEADGGEASQHVSWLGPQADWEVGRAGERATSERYKFGAVFARGGLGAVRRAEDRKLGRAVAVKELLRFDDPRCSGSSARRRSRPACSTPASSRSTTSAATARAGRSSA